MLSLPTPKERKISNFRYAQATITKASGVSFCIHDLRRTFATVAESLDIPAYALKRLLNHANGTDVTAGYIVANVERLREPMQKITDFVWSIGRGKWGRFPLSLSKNGMSLNRT